VSSYKYDASASVPGDHPVTTPLISIIVPSFNQGAFIAETLDSIFGQDYRPIEVLVMDGGSTDETVEVLRRYERAHPELKWQSEPDSGPADAVNKGLQIASGRYVAIQSSDDIYYAGALSAAVRTYSQSPDCGFVYGDCDSFDSAGGHMPRTHLPEFTWDGAFGRAWCYPQGSILFRRDLAIQIGGWNGRYYSCDLDFWMRLAFRAQPKKVEHVMYGWRRYAEQRTRPERHGRLVADYRRMIEESQDIRHSPARIRRLARASVHILAVRYPPDDSLWARRRDLLRASLLHPGHWRGSAPSYTRQLLPGYPLLAALKRKIVGLASRLAGRGSLRSGGH
jgi:glycosyltransferase involved in cell wall biosynthesis